MSEPSDWAKRCYAEHVEMTAAAFRAAVAGEHPLLMIDMNAPMRTSETLPDGRVRMSPDVWRQIMSRKVEDFEIPLVWREPEPSPLAFHPYIMVKPV